MNQAERYLNAQVNARAKNWIVPMGEGYFLAHPRGEKTLRRSHAHGWAYKKEAAEHCKPGFKPERRGK